MIRELLQASSDRISPTAHYTGYVWVRNGLSHPGLATNAGRLFYNALAPANAASARLGQAHLEHYLLARHEVIDHLLTEAIEQGHVAQVIEVAAGLSGRGWRFTRRFGDAITYVEADLPGMAERKRRMLNTTGARGPNHRVEDVDAMRDSGPDSLAELATSLDPSKGLAIITEGLVNYFDIASVQAMWSRFTDVLSGFPTGLYLSDIHLGSNTEGRLNRTAVALLSAFVRGQVHLHFTGPQDAEAALRKAGFAEATLRRPDDFAGTLPHCTGRSARANHIIAASVG
ncbi:class I SAM-dependent methyltransferase [Haloechinothrix salitolerans]|uniref:Class I SAM-dependent methyltransferase n=1 Tax=Haloechinothrix salitolerans TaxID=926830 RepID=A0ABW2BSC8_9PSEU